MKVKFEKFLKQAQYHLGILVRGLSRTLYGTLVAGLVGAAIYGFILIESESGYAAVFDFVAACAILTIALCNMYLLGNKRKGGRK